MAVRVRSRGVRVVRGLLVAGLSVTVAAFSHVAGGGAAPGALGVILSLTFAVFVCIAFGSRALSAGRLALSVALSQVVFHSLFSFGAHLPAGEAGHSSIGMLGMVMSGGQVAGLPAGAGLTGGGGLGAGSWLDATAASDARMWLGHALAALVTVALILRGESAALTLARLGRERLSLLVVIVDALPPSVGVARHAVATALEGRRGLRDLDVLLLARPHRGPPLVS